MNTVTEESGNERAARSPADVAMTGELERLRPYLLRFARSKLNDVHAAEDAVQETLLAVLSASNPFQGRSGLRTWVTSILNHKIIDLYRRNRSERRQDVPGRTDDSDEADDWSEERIFRAMAEPDTRLTLMDPAEEVARRQLAQHLDSAVAGLPARQRDAFVLVHVHGCSGAEAAARVGVSQSNLWIILHRTRKALQAELRMSYAM